MTCQALGKKKELSTLKSPKSLAKSFFTAWVLDDPVKLKLHDIICNAPKPK